MIETQEPIDQNEISLDSEPSQDKEVTYYYDGYSWFEDFERSDEFQKAVQGRLSNLQRAHPEKDISLDSVVETIRGSDEYIYAMHEYYGKGYKIPTDDEQLSRLPERVQATLKEYWDYITFMNRRLPSLRALYQNDRKVLADETIILERQRDKRHVAAALAMLNVQPEDLPNLTSNEVRMGRQLVSLTTEDRGLDIADPQREAKKLYRNIYNDRML